MANIVFSTLIKGVIIYLLFIVGIAIISEWITSKKVLSPMDEMFEEIKNEIKQEYINKFSKRMSNQMQQARKEPFINQYSSDSFPPSSEQALLQEASNRLSMQGGRLNTFANNQEFIGQQYQKIYQPVTQNPNYITQATTSDFGVYKQNADLNAYSEQDLLLPQKTTYNIDNTTYYQPTSGYVPKTFNVKEMDPNSNISQYRML